MSEQGRVASDTVLRKQHDSYVFGFEIVELPQLGPTAGVVDDGPRHTEWTFWQASLLQAVARLAVRSTDLQLRFHAIEPQTQAIRVYLLGRSADAQGAASLQALVRGMLPEVLHVRHLATDELQSLLDPWAPDVGDAVEIRRRRIPLDEDTMLAGGEAGRGSGYVLPWLAGSQAILAIIRIISDVAVPTVFVVHISPTNPRDTDLDECRVLLQELRGYPDLSPHKPEIARYYYDRIRSLPFAALDMAIMIFSKEALLPGLADALAIQIADDRPYDIVRPSSFQHALHWRQVLTDARSLRPEARELAATDGILHKVSVSECASVFRLPRAPYGGLIQVPSARVRALARATYRERQPDLTLGRALSGAAVGLTLNDVNQHVLVAGLPGFGKTTTVKTLLDRLNDAGVPFLVIDPAKRDYREWALARAHRVISLRPGDVAFNPLAIPYGSTPEAYGSRVLAAFDSTLMLSNIFPLGYVTLGRAIFRALAKAYDGEPATLMTLLIELDAVIREARLSSQTENELRLSVLGRLQLLVEGPLGVALLASEKDSVDWHSLKRQSTVIELADFAGAPERSLLFSLLVAGLVSTTDGQVATGLQHVTVLEEAHRVLARTENGSRPNEGVQSFVEAIAEQRGSGVGYIVVDQAPTSLDPRVAKLCGSHVTHRLVENTERATMGASLTLSPEESADLATLDVADIVLHSPSGHSPIMATVQPNFSEGPKMAANASTAVTLSAPSRHDHRFCLNCRGRCKDVNLARELFLNRIPHEAREPEVLLTELHTLFLEQGERTFCALSLLMSQRTLQPLRWLFSDVRKAVAARG